MKREVYDCLGTFEGAKRILGMFYNALYVI